MNGLREGGAVSHVNKGIFDMKPLVRERNGLSTCITLGKFVSLPSLFPARENGSGDKINLSTF